MIAERLLTRRLRGLRDQQLRLEPYQPGTLPAPTHYGGYLLYAHMPLAQKDRLRYRLMIELFGLHLDKKAFRERVGAPVERALWQKYLFLKAVGAFARDDAEALELTETGRYLLVVMMREFFIGVNGIRDLARARLPEHERALFEEEPVCSGPICMPQPAAGLD